MRDEALWCMNPDGREQRRILPRVFGSSSGNRALTLSPDGTRILYTHDPRNLDKYTGDDLFSIRINGTGRRQLTNTNYSLYTREPRFSPNGRQIIYSRRTGYRMGGPGYTDVQIRLMNTDGSRDRRLVGDLDNPDQNHLHPVWSRDGKHILFARTDGCIDYVGGDYPVKFEQRIIDVSGANERPFNGSLSEFIDDSVSPDDKQQIIITRHDDLYGELDLSHVGSYGELRLQNLHGSGSQRLASNTGLVARKPMWSRDGQYIIFEAREQKTLTRSDGTSFNASETAVWSINVDGSGLRRLTEPQSYLVDWLR